jgi:3-hydroxyacyl-[acyl-carrier-protein] dehydratase
MLKDSLFKVTTLTRQEGSITAEIEINKDNGIFDGHFPGQPVLPGACMLQIVKEILEEAFSTNITLQKADQIKFLSIIDPQINSILQVTISYTYTENNVGVIVGIKSNTDVCFKLKGMFRMHNIEEA